MAAVHGSIAGNSDLISRLDRIFCPPPPPCQLAGSGDFALPFFDISMVTLDVERKQHMRISKLKISCGAFDRNRVTDVVCCGSVVWENRSRKGNNSGGSAKPS